MTLAQWLAFIERQHGQPIALGLERVNRVAEALGQRAVCPLITVGGTNGKGSTCAMLERILLSAGYRVGLYTSPHILDYNERVRIDGRPVSGAALCRGFERVEQARTASGGTPLTYFEYGTLCAWEVFAAEPLDAIILEVGLGGRLDATNIYEPDAAIVTSVALDHMDFLGSTREDIGFEKAGIFRAARPAICGDANPPRRLLEHAAAIGADLQILGRDFGYRQQEGQWQFHGRGGQRSGLALPALRGQRQLGNASCALAALDALRERLPVAMQDIRRGLAEVELTGRFQVLPGRPTVVLDVAHNPQAAQVLADNLGSMAFHPSQPHPHPSPPLEGEGEKRRASLEGEGEKRRASLEGEGVIPLALHGGEQPSHAKTWAVFGMMRDKDIAGVIAALRGRIDYWLPATLSGPRAATAAELAAALAASGIPGPFPLFADAAAAYAHARKQASENDRIAAFGSFLTVADVLRA